MRKFYISIGLSIICMVFFLIYCISRYFVNNNNLLNEITWTDAIYTIVSIIASITFLMIALDYQYQKSIAEIKRKNLSEKSKKINSQLLDILGPRYDEILTYLHGPEYEILPISSMIDAAKEKLNVKLDRTMSIKEGSQMVREAYEKKFNLESKPQ